MDVRVLDLVTTRYVARKLAIEMDLENLINNIPTNKSSADFTQEIMSKTTELRNVVADFQTWEGIVNQLTKNPEEGK
jgi:transcriptional regulatory protein LevR